MITLATLNKATAQEVFDQVATHLLAQNKRSVVGISSCRYRNGEGLKCAAGCLISDEEYMFMYEGQSWDRLIRGFGVPKGHSVLIQKLQIVHDSFDPKDWPMELTRVARECSLSTSVIDKFKKQIV